MAVPIIYDEVIEVCSREGEVGRDEIDGVFAALGRLGLDPVLMPVGRDVDASAFRDLGARLVFNCVDSLGGTGRDGHVVPSILDDLGLPYTGARADAIYLTSDKTIAKRLLAAHGLRTPRWCTLERAAQGTAAFGPPYILKHVWEDASIGLDERSVVHGRDELAAAAAAVPIEVRGDLFAEGYVDGREFNVSLLAGADGPLALSPLEIEFHGYAAGRPRIVDYKAKWEAAPDGVARIARRFDFAPADARLLAELSASARRCWEVFGLTGYARVDFRVDAAGTPWILEINANPYLGDDSSFLAAAARAGLAFDDVVRRIVEDALRRSEPAPRS
jgi:D-alanine-D-alanine ligase